MKQLSFLFTGDVMAHANQLQAARNEITGSYDFSGNFRNIRNYVRNVDVAVCNLETTIAGGEPSSYPRFNTPVELVDAIAEAGFSCVAAANNHSYDTNRAGIVKTRMAVEERNLQIAGIRKKPEDKAYAILEVKGIKVALLNFTFETAGKDGKRTLNNRPMTPEARALLNSFCFETLEEDLEAVRKEVTAAREEGAQIILVYYHWGNEYERYSNVFQKYVAWKTAYMGVDAIIGSHAHVMQELGEIRVSDTKTVPVFYGLGNYIWGAPPIYERETVLNNILAMLDVRYEEDTGNVQVVPSYVPLYIGQKNGAVETLDMMTLPVESYDAFAECYGIRPEKVLEQIRETVENRLHPVTTEWYFDRVFRLKAGERMSLLKDFLPDRQYVEFRSEDTLVASALQNGYVIGNAPGYAGLTAVDTNGNEVIFMVQVLPGEESRFPVVVNSYNLVRDIYLPPNRVSGDEYGLGEKLQLCKPVAEAWKAMHTAAAEEGVYLKAVHGMRFKIDQIKRRANYAKMYGDAAAQKRYRRFGYTEHHLGTCVDVAPGTLDGAVTPKAEAYGWLREHAWKYGFVPRKFTAKIDNVAYLHLRHLEDQALVELLHRLNISLEEYLTNYEQYENV